MMSQACQLRVVRHGPASEGDFSLTGSPAGVVAGGQQAEALQTRYRTMALMTWSPVPGGAAP